MRLGNGLRVDVTDIRSNALSSGDIVEGELADERVHLQKQEVACYKIRQVNSA